MGLRVLWTHRHSGGVARGLEPPEGVELRVETDRERALALRDWPEVLVDGGPPEELLDGASLARVVVPYAGLGARLRGYLLARPRLRAHNSHFNDAMVAQHAAALLLAVASRVAAGDRALRRGDWGPPEHGRDGRGLFLRGGKALLLGYGRIAQATARYKEHREIYFQARYQAAHCYYEYATHMRAPADREKYLKYAKDCIVVTYRLYPKLGGAEWYPKYNALLKKIQSALRESPVGLAAETPALGAR